MSNENALVLLSLIIFGALFQIILQLNRVIFLLERKNSN